MQVVPAAGVASSYTDFLTIVVLKIHIYNFIVKSSFLVKIVRCTKPSSVCFLCKDSTRILKIRLQKHNGNEQQRKRPDLNMTET